MATQGARRYLAYTKNYFRETTVHGLRYMVEGSNIFERALWTLCVILVFVLASFMISDSIDDIRRNPVLTTIHAVHVSELPKPALSVNLENSKLLIIF